MKFIKILLIFCILNSCKKNDVKEIEVFRFDKELASVDSVNIDQKLLKWDSTLNGFHHFYYSDFLNYNYENSDSLKNLILEGVYHQEIRLVSEEISNEFQDFTDIENEIESVFGMAQLYFPEMILPSYVVTINGERTYNITFTSESADTVVVALDMYLGELNRAYDFAPLYLKNMFQRKYIALDILDNWFNINFKQYNKKETFLDYLIYEGKIMYLIFKCMPNHDPENIFKFSKDEYDACESIEPVIWERIQEKDLYSANDYYEFFNYSAPLGVFIINGDTVPAPSRLGYFIGYKIIDSYMKENDISLKELMSNTNSQEILLKSKYSPGQKNQESWLKKYWWISFVVIFFLGYFLYKRYSIKR